MSKNKVQGLGLRALRYDPTSRVQGSRFKAESSKVDRSASKPSSFPAFQPMSYDL
jgi:hypothetical protein